MIGQGAVEVVTRKAGRVVERARVAWLMRGRDGHALGIARDRRGQVGVPDGRRVARSTLKRGNMPEGRSFGRSAQRKVAGLVDKRGPPMVSGREAPW